jgi:hypothetical protein
MFEKNSYFIFVETVRRETNDYATLVKNFEREETLRKNVSYSNFDIYSFI